jgi:hypothetical protein
MDLAREVAAVPDPDRVRARAQLAAELDAVHVVRDRLLAHGPLGVAQAAELVRQLLPGLVLEGVGVHRVEEEPASLGVGHQLARVLRLVPGDVQRDPGRHPHQRLDHLAVVELLEHAPRLAGPGEAGEARAAGADAPGRHGDAERGRALGQALDVDAAPGELSSEVRVVFLEPVHERPVVLGDEASVQSESHRPSVLCSPRPLSG